MEREIFIRGRENLLNQICSYVSTALLFVPVQSVGNDL